MENAATRKLIDIKAPVFLSLTQKARRKGVSLKRYIEDLLEEDAMTGSQSVPQGVTDAKILSLIGMAKPTVRPEDYDDERLNYILSK
jgi:hypothetical protein